MSDLERVVDKFSGFITKEQAESLLKAESDTQPKPSGETRRPTTNVKEMLKSLPKKLPQVKLESADSESVVNIKDHIYRIFNPSSTNVRGRETTKRTVILGEEGSTIVFSIRDKLSDFIDINTFERGDTVIVNNAIVDSDGELKSGQNTIINKVMPTKMNAITDYSTVKEEQRKVDVIGRIVEISPIRHVTRLGKEGQIAVASCIITDSTNMIDASFWGSSALTTANLKTNDFIKLEFCDIRMRDGKLQIYANDDSRVVSSSAFGQRLKK